MSRLLTYLADLPHHGSPLMFPTLYALAKSIDVAEWPSRLHPSLEGRGQVAWRDLKRMKDFSTHMVRALQINYLPRPAAFVESRGSDQHGYSWWVTRQPPVFLFHVSDKVLESPSSAATALLVLWELLTT
jgi:hypothetical protein